MKAFKIKNAEGKFSTGSQNPRFTNRGKTWGSLQAIKLHLRQFCDQGGYKIVDSIFYRHHQWENNIPSDWIVVELSEDGLKEYPAKQLYPPTEKEKIWKQ